MRHDDIVALKEERKRVHDEMVALFGQAEGEQREFTGEETEQYEKMDGEFRSLTKRWETAQRLYEEQDDVERALNLPLALNAGDTDNLPDTLSEWRTARRGVPAQDTLEYRQAWFHYMSTRDDHELDIEEKRVLSRATAGAGANLVPTMFRNEIINISRHMGPINELANTITTDAGETIQIPSVTAHGTAAWMAENAAFTPSDETFGQPSLGAFKAGTKVIVSEELLQDSAFGLDSYLAQEFGERIGVLEETAFTVGDGASKPLGIAHASSGVSIVQAATGSATSFTYAALVNFIYALPYPYRRNAVFVFSDSAVKSLYLLVDGQQRPLWNVNVATSGPDTLLGYPVYTSPDLAVSAASAKAGIFGDIRRGYMIRRVNGFALQRQNELHSDNGQVGFRGYHRVDGRVVLADAMRVLQHSAT